MGENVGSQNIKNKNFESFEISGTFFSSEVKYNDKYIEYKKKKIYYKDINAVSISGLTTNAYFTSSTRYDFTIYSSNQEISMSVNSPATFITRETSAPEEWVKLMDIYAQYIEPVVMIKLIEDIFRKRKLVVIGDVSFDYNGYSRSKFFGGNDFVSWGDIIYAPQIITGEVILYKDKHGRATIFTKIKLEKLNAIILPRLIDACVTIYSNNLANQSKPD